MTGASYLPGTWLGIVRSGTAVLLGPESSTELAGALWQLLAGRPEPHEVLAAVTSSSGGSLTRIPSFGILAFNGSLRVFLRGDIDLTVEQPAGPVDLDGRDVTTWNERRFVVPGMCRLGIAAGGTAGQAGGQPGLPLAELPLGEGVVLLQSLTLGGPSGPAAVGGPAAADRTEAVPTPATADGPFAVNASGEVDTAAVPNAPSAAVPQRDALPEPEDLAGITILPEQEASAETVAGVIDVELQDDGDLPPRPAAHGVDPDATIAPGEETGAAPAVETTTSYDHLWDRTVMRNIEDAAVREEVDADSGHVSPQQQPALPAAEALPVLEAAQGVAPQGPPVGSKARGAGSFGPAGSGPGPDEAPATAARPASSGVLIDSVPWRTGGATPASAAPASSPAPTPGTPPPPSMPAPLSFSAGPGGPARKPGAADDPVREQEAGAAFDPDHDGQTVMKSSIPGTAPGPAMNAAVQQDAGGGPLVLARVCARGHANPPTHALCSACGAALLPDAIQVARPRLGRMRLSTGELLDLDQSMVIGRQPSVSRVQGGVMPRLVQVASPGGDISRSHVEVRLEGWHVMLCDLKATNGTVLVREGQPPRRLAQNEMAILLDGDIAELGDNISLRFEEIP
ncbi:FHA domain-containing protein [Arthrobacter liuii]|uniref:FHA domain-containing protein n=1 Tax=Arthrobacter liuii TaxID=1476996 RepID=A0ABQ2AF37_9MICC|nr:FHA domain-containing protein [Arthrobacter liuii]GGH89734.1 hypothetical protein GCM10007170_01850 [Arthrobacter liuii]